MRLNKLLNALAGAGLFASVVGCSDSVFKSGAGSAVSPGPNQQMPALPNPLPTGPLAPNPLQQHKVALAAKHFACTICHAKIDGNVVTDFFTDINDRSAAQTIAAYFHPGIVSGRNAKSFQLLGDFIIPKGDISVADKQATGGVANCSWNPLEDRPTVKLPLLKTLQKCMEPYVNWGALSKHFVEKSKVKIYSLSNSAEIKALWDSGAEQPSGHSLLAGATIDGLTGSSVSGYKLSGNVQCNGAIALDGPVSLIGVSFIGAGSCRLYSTKGIFVFKGIKYDDPKGSLQLMSSSYIGIDITYASAYARLVGERGGYGAYFNRMDFSVGDLTKFVGTIKTDSDLLGATGIGEGSFDYERIALAAPVVFSRSTGIIKGSIVAELFIGVIGATKYAFDPVYGSDPGSVALWPEIKTPLVEIAD